MFKTQTIQREQKGQVKIVWLPEHLWVSWRLYEVLIKIGRQALQGDLEREKQNSVRMHDYNIHLSLQEGNGPNIP